MAVGTVIYVIPQVALSLAILAGLLVTMVLGPAYMSTGRKEVELNQISSGLWGYDSWVVFAGNALVSWTLCLQLPLFTFHTQQQGNQSC